MCVKSDDQLVVIVPLESLSIEAPTPPIEIAPQPPIVLPTMEPARFHQAEPGTVIAAWNDDEGPVVARGEVAMPAQAGIVVRPVPRSQMRPADEYGAPEMGARHPEPDRNADAGLGRGCTGREQGKRADEQQ